MDLPSHIQIPLRSLLAILPDNILAYPRSEMPQHFNLEQPVRLAIDSILPQLASARVTLPLITILDALPPGVIAAASPIASNTTVTLPLHEIVAQLPPRFFTARLSQRTAPELQALSADIPSPFQERKPSSAPIQAPTPEPEAPLAEEIPAPLPPPPQPVPTPQPVVITPTPETPAPPAPIAPPPPEVVTPPTVLETPIPVPPSSPVRVAVPPPAPTKPVVPVAAPSEAPAPAGPLDEKRFLIDLNRCSAEDLLNIKGIGPSLAKRIVAHRAEHGRFNSLDDLRQVPGVGRKTFRALAGAKPQAINHLLGVAEDQELTLQEIVRLAGKLPGLQGCMLATADGLLLTGEVPPHLDQEAISVFAPQLFKRVARYTKELKVGEVSRFTIFTDQQPVSIFGAEDVFFVVLHDQRRFSKRLLRQCERISFEIARLCRQRTTV